MAGGEPRFGTTAIYMPTLLLQTSDSVKTKEAHISLVTCQHSASEDLNNVLISRDFSGQPKRELQLRRTRARQSRSSAGFADAIDSWEEGLGGGCRSPPPRFLRFG